MWVIRIVMSVGLTAIVSLFSVCFNIVNAIVFMKQITRNSSNVALLGLAVSDAGASLSLLFWGQQFNPLFWDYLPDINLQSIMFLATVWPPIIFTRVICWITAYIIIERYLCIAIPLRVKEILEVKRTT